MIERRNLLKSINMTIWLKNKLEMILFLKLIKIKKAIKLNLANIIWNIEFINCKMEHIILEG